MTARSESQDADPFVVLFKLGDADHMHALLYEGELYLNTFEYFKKLEDGTPRSDRDEALLLYLQMDGGTLEIREQDDDDWSMAGTIIGGARLHDSRLENANMYCLHARRASQCAEPWKLDYLEFGESFVVFFDPAEFLRRVRIAAEKLGHSVSWQPVEYVDRQRHHGQMGPFRKFSERERDSEFRIVVQPGDGGPLRLSLGSLTDIAFLGNASHRMKLIPKDVSE